MKVGNLYLHFNRLDYWRLLSHQQVGRRHKQVSDGHCRIYHYGRPPNTAQATIRLKEI